MLGIPILYIFVRYGLLALATSLAVNQALQLAPPTLDPTRPHALASSVAIILIGRRAAYASSISRAGGGFAATALPAA